MGRSLLYLFLAASLSCSTRLQSDQKSDQSVFYKGVNFVGTSSQQDGSCFNPLVELNANSVSIIPFAYGSESTGKLTIQPNWQWWGESEEGVRTLTQKAHEKGLSVMIKPQIWFDFGTYTGNVDLKEESKWKNFETGYRQYILNFAKLAESENVELFCIGTELKEFVLNRPDFWNDLIKEIKSIYSGTLTYAGNWDSYKMMPFWNQLDFIGVDAYFPVSDSKSPSSEEIEKGWSEPIKELREISTKHNKKILFCEFGFRSMPFSGSKPWESKNVKEVDLEAQKNAFIGTFNSVWKEDFLAGGFIWKWFPDHNAMGGKSCNRFTPQNKPAQQVISAEFNK